MFLLEDEEAKTLYQEGHKAGGVLSRQYPESVTSYITRREHWYKLLKSMDTTATLTDEKLYRSHVVDNAGISEMQKLLILTSVQNSGKIADIAGALKKQCSKIQFGGGHEKPSASTSSAYGGKGSRQGKGNGKGYGRTLRPHKQTPMESYRLKPGAYMTVDI